MKKATKSAMVFLSLCAAFLLFSCSADNSIESKDKYTINIVPSANGVVSASAETAEQGKTIILTVIPDSGYRLAPDSLAVIGLEGNLNDAGADADGYKQYSFIMPGDDITVICDFELKPAIVYAVNLAAMQNGTVASSVSEAALGDTVTLTVKPNENFEYTAGSLKVNDGSVTLTAIADDAEGFLRFNFLMPGEIVTVKCSFEEIEVQPQQSYVITVSPSISNGTVYTSPISSKAGSLVAICIKAHEGYAYQESSLKVNGSEEGINFAGELDGELWFLFTMPAEDVNIVCAFYDPTPVYYPINTAGIKSGTVTPDLAEAAENAVVTLTLKPNNNYEYIESSLKINNGAVELTAISDDAQGNKRFTFVMPAENVTVSCTFVYNGPAVDYFSKDYDESITSFSDKFDTSGANHTAGGVNLDKWGFQNGNGSEYGIWGWGNTERQSYRTENVTVTDGILTINAKYQTGFNGMNYTSGKLVSANSKGNINGEPPSGAGEKFGQTYGRFEAKIRMNAGIGAWPAFWMMPVEAYYGGWPRSGEIDIMEMTGDRLTHSSSTLHVMPTGGGQGSGSTWHGVNHTFMDNSTYEDWHIYGVIWTPTEMIFLLDGYVCRTLLNTWWQTGWYAANSYPGSMNSYPPFNRDFHFIINLALDSGQFRKENGIDNNQTNLNYTLEVDWVRAYTLENDPWETLGNYPSNLKSDY